MLSPCRAPVVASLVWATLFETSIDVGALIEQGYSIVITLVFKNGKERTFAEAAKVTRKGGVIVLAKSDGSEIGTFDAEQIIVVSGGPGDRRSNGPASEDEDIQHNADD